MIEVGGGGNGWQKVDEKGKNQFFTRVKGLKCLNLAMAPI